MEKARSRVPVIGLLGAVASGKSAVAAELAQLGAVVYDADRRVSELLEEPEIIAAVDAAFGNGVVSNGRVVKVALADAVFGSSEKRLELEGILHPPVVGECRELAARPPDSAEAVVLDAPLLLEAGLGDLCDELWFVETPFDIRIERARESRGWDEAELRRRESAQVSVEEKRALADRVIRNGGAPADMRKAVNRAFEEVLRSSGGGV